MDAALGLAPLTPLAQLDRAAEYFPDRTAYRFEGASTTYAGLHDQVRRAAGRLVEAGVQRGDRVAVLARNVPVALVAHFAVPWAGGVLVALNHRLSAGELRGILEHAEPRLLVAEGALAGLADDATAGLDVPVLADDDVLATAASSADAVPQRHGVTDELDLITLNYTSGTTGSPKGVMYRHRGAALQSIAMAYHLRLEMDSVYLWTLPMFHCNGWSFPWAVAAAGATSLCTGTTDPEQLWRLIRDETVTHFCAAPTLLTGLLTSPAARPVEQPLTVATGGAPPTPSLIRRAEQLGLHVVHLYGLTETYGPSLICDWQPEWDGLPEDEQAEKLSRQGIPNIMGATVTLEPVPGDDGRGLAELTIAGNTVMAGYYRDQAATAAATVGDDRFRTGDLGVQHPDRYYQLQDRAKDVIISGGENISSIEVERVLAEHPAVSESAVVARADETWGEVPVAFVTLAGDAGEVSEDELIEFVKSRIARYKAPKHVVFGPLPKTATGKIQKFELRSRVAAEPEGPAADTSR
jgi:fatty-acyl-CoA synthase